MLHILHVLLLLVHVPTHRWLPQILLLQLELFDVRLPTHLLATPEPPADGAATVERLRPAMEAVVVGKVVGAVVADLKPGLLLGPVPRPLALYPFVAYCLPSRFAPSRLAAHGHLTACEIASEFWTAGRKFPT